MKKTIYTNHRGISIIEALVTLSIIALGLIPILGIAVLSLQISSRIKNNLIGTNLAQEGIEIVRALRDEDWFRYTCFGSACSNGNLIGTWKIQHDSNLSANPPQPIGSNPPLNINGSGIYTYGIGTPTGFTRKVIVTEVKPGVELKIISTVEWPSTTTVQGCSPRKSCITIESHLFNWL